MRFTRTLALAALAAAIGVTGLAGAAQAQNEQFIPMLVYRTGPYAPNGVPFANGFADYINMINERDGGVNGVKLATEECETGYATDRGVECFDRLKGKGPTGAAFVHPLSTGITFALIEKAPTDKIPVMSVGYGRSEAADGRVFPWVFPLLGTYWSAADILVHHLANTLGGYDKLKGKKITLVFHDSPYGKEPIPVLQELSKRHGYVFEALPVTAPGVEQKAVWLQIRQSRPDYVFLWGWGVMNSTSIKEAAAVNFPRNRMYGVWWSGAEPDVIPAESGATGYNSLALHATGTSYSVVRDVLKHLYDKGKGAAKREEVGQVLYNRGLVSVALGIEGIRVAQERFGKKPLTGEQVRWGIENLNLTPERINQMGFEGLMAPLKVSCIDHEGGSRARIQQWDGKAWKFTSDWITADDKLLRPIVESAAAKYAQEKSVTARDCTKG